MDKRTILSKDNKFNQDEENNEKIDFIKKIVCEYYGEPIEDLQSKSRMREMVTVRQVCMYLMAKNTTASLDRMGKEFNRDHCTVLYAKRTIAGYLTWDKDLAFEVKEIQTQIDLRFKEMMLAFANKVGECLIIDLDDFVACKISAKKTVLLVGFSGEEANKFIEHNDILPLQCSVHKQTGLYYLKKKNERNKNNG